MYGIKKHRECIEKIFSYRERLQDSVEYYYLLITKVENIERLKQAYSITPNETGILIMDF